MWRLALGAIGPEARAAIPTLTEMAKDKDAKANKAAADALEEDSTEITSGLHHDMSPALTRSGGGW